MDKTEHFKTPIWTEHKPEFVKSLNKASDKYIKKSKNRPESKKYIKQFGDFGVSWHSTPLLTDNDFIDLRNYIGQKSWEFLNYMGFDMEQYKTIFSEMWVQEFAKKGGGHHSAHIHSNQHVSGFYFLKCGPNTSMPVFHDPRVGLRTTKLNTRPQPNSIFLGTELVHFKPQPGTLLIFPAYLEHEFAVDHGKEPFRFIHWNITAIPSGMAKDG
jgi:uncharacterized protein (TIGR02466 family)